MDRLPSRDHRAKTPKKKTKNRRVLIQNLKKARSRKEDRCAFQLIPYPSKFAGTNRIYFLPGDVALMECNDNLVSEASLYNNFKIYKHAQVVECPGQRMVKIKMETKNVPYDDWRQVVERLSNSESKNMRDWADMLKNYYLQYDVAMEHLKMQQEITPQKLQALKEMNERTQKTKQSLIKSYPCIEFRVELRDGQIQMTQFSVSEKYADQIGYTLESFAATALEEGIPEVTPLNSPGAAEIARLRIERGVTLEQENFQSKEYESTGIMKNGYIKKARVRAHFLTFFEKGVLGFIFIGAVVTKLKPEIDAVKIGERPKVNADFVDLMAGRENETKSFLSMYYNQSAEQKYTNLYKTCGVKEIENLEDI